VFVVIKMVSRLLFPVPVILLALVAGWWIWARGRRVRLGKWLTGAAIGVLALMSFGPVGDGVLRPLENRYPVLDQRPDGVMDVVVLGAGTDYVEGDPASLCLNDSARARVMEGVRLAGREEGARLVFTGSSGNEGPSCAELGARTAELMGVGRARIVVLGEPRNTREEVAAVVELLGDRPIVLVTCASHLPRAMAMFEKAGARPVAAPSSFMTRRAKYKRSPWGWYPGAGEMEKVERAVYEYLGLAWFWVSG